MKILAIDTTSTACSVALLNNGEVSARHEVAPMQQAKLVLSFVQDVLQHHKLTELDAIAFGCGPGSFTGVRIGVSVAQGLAFAAKLPLISISSLAATAQATYEQLGWEKLLVGIDARMNEVYWAAYQVENGLVTLQDREVVCAAQAVSLPQQSDWYGVGSAWDVYREHIPYHPLAIAADQLPTAMAILTLAKKKFANQEWCSPLEAAPVYLRDQVAIAAK